MNNIGLTLLEDEVLKWLLAGEDPVIVALQIQLKGITSIHRELTGHGFYLNFNTRPNLIPLHNQMAVKENFSFGDVEAKISSLNSGAGFLLWIKNGIISSLEGYTYDEVWPEEIKEFRLRYLFSPDRNWQKLHQQWEQNPKRNV